MCDERCSFTPCSVGCSTCEAMNLVLFEDAMMHLRVPKQISHNAAKFLCDEKVPSV